MSSLRALDSLEELQTFVAIVDRGSFAAAAKALGVSANAVSRRQGVLEGRLGRRLLHRTTRRLSVTEEGMRFYQRCTEILATTLAAEREVMGTGAIEGVLRVAVHNDILGTNFFVRLGELMSSASDLRVELKAVPRFLDPIEHGLDLAIHVGPPPPSSLHAVRLGEFFWGLAATPTYISANGRPRKPEQLIDHECLRVLREMPERTWRLARGGGPPRRFAIGGRLHIDDGSALAGALYAGLGIGVRPRTEIDEAVKQGRLVAVLSRWSWAATPLFALVPKGLLRVPRVRAFLDVLKTTKGLRSSG